MNKIDKVDIKENITDYDKANVIDFVTSFIVGVYGDTGEKYYRPYYMRIAMTTAIAKYLIDGVEFDENENIYVSAIEDNEVGNLVKMFMENHEEEMGFITSALEDTIEFRKQCVIHENPDIDEEVLEILTVASEAIQKEKQANELALNTLELQNKLLEYQNKVQEQFTPEETAELTRKMADSDFDVSKIGEVIAEKYFASDAHVDKLEEVIDADKEKIRDLKQYKAVHDARNVLDK